MISWSSRAGTAAACRWADRTSGAISSTGIELARRIDGTELYGVTTPLITKADGSKMGKSVSGAVWLNEDQLSSFDYWQFWRNTDDRDVGKFLRLFTDLRSMRSRALEALQGSEINEAKKVLANEATALCRGRDAADARPPRRRASRSRKALLPMPTCPPSMWETAASALSPGADPVGAGRIGRRSQAQDRRRGRAHRRRAGPRSCSCGRHRRRACEAQPGPEKARASRALEKSAVVLSDHMLVSLLTTAIDPGFIGHRHPPEKRGARSSPTMPLAYRSQDKRRFSREEVCFRCEFAGRISDR